MEREVIYSKLNEIFEDVLDLDETPSLSDETTADDIEEWDSLSFVQLVVAIQIEFNVKFLSAEIVGWKTVGDMVKSIESKL